MRDGGSERWLPVLYLLAARRKMPQVNFVGYRGVVASGNMIRGSFIHTDDDE